MPSAIDIAAGRAEDQPEVVKHAPHSTADGDVTVTLSDGRKVVLREPTAGDLRGVQLLDAMQFNPGAYGKILERISDFPVADFYALKMRDAREIMVGVLGFLAPEAIDT